MIFILYSILIVRIYLQVLTGLAVKFLPFNPSFPYWETTLQPLAPKWLWLWGNFDGAHYIKLAQFGYKEAFTQAFFPLYPALIRWFNFITQNGLISGLIISHLALIGFFYYFYKLGRFDFPKKTLIWASLFLLLFPTSFFLFSVYTESLFLFLCVFTFFLLRKKKFLPASIVAGLASATRLVGIFLLPAVLWEYYKTKKVKTPKLIGLSLLSISGFLFYLNFLNRKFDDVLIFINSQPSFGAGRQTNQLVMIYQVVWRYLKMFFAVDPSNNIYPVLVLECTLSVLFLGLIIYAVIKKLRKSYLLFLVPAYLLPTLTGTFLSMPRMLLACFPLFYLLGDIKSKPVKILLLVISTLLLSWSFLRFSQGYWLS